jgi:hypothetical protein
MCTVTVYQNQHSVYVTNYDDNVKYNVWVVSSHLGVVPALKLLKHLKNEKKVDVTNGFSY